MKFFISDTTFKLSISELLSSFIEDEIDPNSILSRLEEIVSVCDTDKQLDIVQDELIYSLDSECSGLWLCDYLLVLHKLINTINQKRLEINETF